MSRFIYENEIKHYQTSKHPVRFSFFKADMSLKDQDRMLEYLKQELGIMIRVSRENKMSVFMSSEQSNRRCIMYCFNNLEKIINNFNIKGYVMDL